MAQKPSNTPSFMAKRNIKESDKPIVQVNATDGLPENTVLYEGLDKKPANRTYKVNPKYRDFRVFLKMMWEKIGLPPPTPTQLDIANYLQGGLWEKNVDGEFIRSPEDESDYPRSSLARYKVVLSWRGAAKTLITSAFGVWLLYWNPQFKILIVSSGGDFAKQIMQFARDVIMTTPLLEPLVPNPGQLNSVKGGINVSAAIPAVQPSLLSLGIGGQTRGKRADFILVDDIETVKNTATQNLRFTLVKQIEEFWNQITPGGTIVFLGTPARASSIYTEELIEPDGHFRCDIRIFPVRVPTSDQIDFYGDKLGCLVKDLIEQGVPEWTAYDPRFTEEILNNEKRISNSSFMLEYMLDTSQTDSNLYPLQLSDLMVSEINLDYANGWYQWNDDEDNRDSVLPSPGFKRDFWCRAVVPDVSQKVEFTKRLMAIDPSGRGNDKTAYVILFLSRGKLFLMKADSVSGGYTPETFELLALTAQQFKVNHIIVEPNFGDGVWKEAFAPTLQRYHPCKLDDAAWSSARKEERIIQSLELVVNRHKLVVDRSVVIEDSQRDLIHQLFYQYTHIVRRKGALNYDDLLDALAIGVAYFNASYDLWADDKQVEEEKNVFSALEREHARYGIHLDYSSGNLRISTQQPKEQLHNFVSFGHRRFGNG